MLADLKVSCTVLYQDFKFYIYTYIFAYDLFFSPLDFESYKEKDRVYFMLIHDHVSQATNTVCDLVIV